MKRRRWPDLAFRARNAKSVKSAKSATQDWPGKRQPSAQPSEMKFGDALVALLAKVVEEAVGAEGAEGGMTEDEYIVHLKDCVGCRKNVASLARMGMKISSKILVAAGVEVLN